LILFLHLPFQKITKTMQFAPYLEKFPLIAEEQTRRVIVLKETDSLPKIGEYPFINAYCMDKKCDCRRAMIMILDPSAPKASKPMNIISYGWESKSYYKKIFPHMDDATVNWFKGPDLDQFQNQSQYGSFFLDEFKLALQQPNYSNRIIRHYVQFKWKIGMKLPKDLEPWLGVMSDCGCKSGYKFKFCCGKKKD
jgi:hypothetical protein